MARLLVKGAQIVTMDPALGDMARADILVEDGAISAIAPALDAGDAQIIDGADKIALPGIIDAHNCLWQTVLRGYVPDLWPGQYFTHLLPLRQKFAAEDNYNATYVGGFEMLSYGTTTVVDYCHNVGGPGFADASIKGLRESGIRHVFTYSFMKSRPSDFATREERFADAQRIYDTFHDPDSITTLNFGVDSPGSQEIAGQLEFARRLKANSAIHIHTAGPVGELHRMGLLGPDLMVIHANMTTNEELGHMAAAGAPICFTPTADVQGTPVDVVRRAKLRGIDVVFGCDIPCTIASDTMGQLRIIHNVQSFLDGAMERSFNTVSTRRPAVGPDMPLLKPRTLLEIATITTARVLGMDDRIGSLTPGKRADILLVNKGPFGDSIIDDPCAHVMLQTSPRDIDTVIVDGKVRMSAGVLKDFDPKRAKALIAESRKRIFG
ncbi:amidohydrolase family protein [Aquabacter sp. CN5-332]|uniref:amidohydrolase family protein n=1 Tax=Aquabacter sp. CN5-332 TaxID=3156608 RepID=UPI0032B5FA98